MQVLYNIFIFLLIVRYFNWRAFNVNLYNLYEWTKLNSFNIKISCLDNGNPVILYYSLKIAIVTRCQGDDILFVYEVPFKFNLVPSKGDRNP